MCVSASAAASSTKKGSGAGGRAKRYCICRKTMEESTDQDWIACDGCEEWYHLKCIGLTKKAAAKVAVYQCDNCRVSLLLLLVAAWLALTMWLCLPCGWPGQEGIRSNPNACQARPSAWCQQPRDGRCRTGTVLPVPQAHEPGARRVLDWLRQV